ncbi:lantibiotic dehydratase [Nonomuraea sp. KC401]|uniref:lantibiotic dehydratase n=2 Tax=unclassified Nonomuraea TaxID=2593643 RepID=UPI0010FF317B|nr:lantibiotic dehydratase [Nonomuraea sp. KC401]NBE99050.1 lantibiotic dehydratase [Nonomuraea sp. K271]TLF55623.1 lantibiotic dehydratase [Nonomuraea sp. KC401]
MYRYLDAAVLRAAAWPPHQQVASWPGLTHQGANSASWRTWLARTWQIPGFAAAVEQASPDLARRVREICSGEPISDQSVRRAVLSVMRYLLRASGRATPFGLFAGVAPARISAATDLPAARIGDAHRPIARVTAEWLAAVVQRLEGEKALRRRLTVVANNLAFERDGRLVLEHRASPEAGGAPGNVSVRATGPVRAALRLARDPLPVADLMDGLSAPFPRTAESMVDALVAELVAQRLLLTSLRPPMPACDPLRRLLRELEAVNADEIGEVADIVKVLRDVAGELDDHDRVPAALAADHRARAVAAMAAIQPTERPPLAVDLRLDAQVTVPAAVAAEAATAAAAIVRLANLPALNTGWMAWHQRFLDRYGPRALVPLRDVVEADIGLGYPAGFDDGDRVPEEAALTDRDRKLLALAHNAAMRRQREILLDDTMIADLGRVAPDAPVQPSTDLTVRIDAPSTAALAEGRFTLTIVGASRAAGTITGRFLDMFDDEHRQRMSTLYAGMPTSTREALAVQVSAPAPYIGTDNVARALQVLPQVLPVGDHPGGTHVLALDDLAVTADHGIYLVSLSRRHAVEPVILNAVNLIQHTHPLTRFILQAPHALQIPCAGFDWGLASVLPFVPALRYQRTIISPARWRLTAADLPTPSADWTEWDNAFTAWLEMVALPETVSLGGGDQHLRLDLCEPAHRVLLRAQVDRTGTAVLRVAPHANAAGWIGGLAHEVVIPLAATGQPAEPPRLPNEVTFRDHGHLPGQNGRLSLKLYCHPDRHDAILIRHLPRLVETLGSEARWWFLRYHDPDHHLRIRLTVPDHTYADAAAEVTAWSERVRQAGLTSRVQWDTYFPETARFGGPSTMDAAEAYFAADSATVVTQLTAIIARKGPHLHALTAASLLDIASAFLGDHVTAMRWLFSHAQADASAPDRAIYDQAVRLARPGDHGALAACLEGEQIVSWWARRRKALASYRRALEEAGTIPPAAVLPDLLHLHHVSMAGTSPASERACLHLARAAALSWTARPKRSRS